MSDWTQGYVSDIEYLPGFYAEQTPAHLDVVCLLKGMEPPVEAGQTYNYCELGCGVGESALAIAAASPDSRVWGFDFNPAHIARANKLATASGLGNIVFEEASFETLANGSSSHDLPAFDYIALHGVWSWVSIENRAHIVRFIDRHLKPGGLVYVTYNALPGWASAVPLQRMLYMFGTVGSDRSDRRIVDALAMVREFADAGVRALPQELLESLSKEKNLAYLSHEYLNEHWAPCFHADVARDLATAKLSYVGTANILENFPDVSLSKEQRELLARAPAAISETLKDYFLERTFRRDVFVRGARAIPDRRLDSRIAERSLCLVVPPKAVTRDIRIPLGTATLNERFYGPALEALTGRPHTIGELMRLPGTEKSTATPREVLGMLVGSRQAMLMTGAPAEAGLAAVRAYNAVHLRACADEGRAVCALAATGVGSALTVRLFEMLAYEVLVAGCAVDVDAVTTAIWQLLASRDDRIRHEGEIIEDEQESLRLLRENVKDILALALPIWQRTGAI